MTKYTKYRISTHPGEILLEEFMKPLKISANSLAMDLHVPANRILAIVKEKRAITVDTALRLSRYFKTSPEFWLNLQTSYDLSVARTLKGKEIEQDVKIGKF